jgi:hypothetical protein
VPRGQSCSTRNARAGRASSGVGRPRTPDSAASLPCLFPRPSRSTNLPRTDGMGEFFWAGPHLFALTLSGAFLFLAVREVERDEPRDKCRREYLTEDRLHVREASRELMHGREVAVAGRRDRGEAEVRQLRRSRARGRVDKAARRRANRAGCVRFKQSVRDGEERRRVEVNENSALNPVGRALLQELPMSL